jgi:hypothetical protein
VRRIGALACENGERLWPFRLCEASDLWVTSTTEEPFCLLLWALCIRPGMRECSKSAGGSARFPPEVRRDARGHSHYLMIDAIEPSSAFMPCMLWWPVLTLCGPRPLLLAEQGPCIDSAPIPNASSTICHHTCSRVFRRVRRPLEGWPMRPNPRRRPLRPKRPSPSPSCEGEWHHEPYLWTGS